MSKFSDWLVKAGILYPRPSVGHLTPTSTTKTSELETVVAEVESAVKSAASIVKPQPKVVTSMNATKVSFHRLHKFVENGVAFTPAQEAAAVYKVVIGSAKAGAQVFSVPPALLAGVAGNAAVQVPFASLGFSPQPGVAYSVEILCTVDGIDSSASAAVTFTNSYTPAAVEAVSVG